MTAKSFENLSAFDEITGKSMVAYLFDLLTSILLTCPNHFDIPFEF